MFRKKTIKDIDLKNKTVLVRVDYNVPLDENRRVTDDTRLTASRPTIEYLLSQGSRIVLMSHLGRPGGLVKPELSLAPVADAASKVLGRHVKFSSDTIGDNVKKEISSMERGGVILLENLRFNPGETKNSEEFSKSLAELAEVYVNDAFGTAHRAHASTVGVTNFLHPAVAGLLIEKELKYLGEGLSNPARPFLAILGGAKVSDKIPVIRRLLEMVDIILIGGGMMFTFIKARGGEIGDSLLENDIVDTSLDLLKKAADTGKSIILPTDVVAADAFSADANTRIVSADAIPSGWKGLDIGPVTIQLFKDHIRKAKTIIWNGPMGVFEMEPFAKGTFEVAKAIADSDSVSIIGGGDSVSAIKKSGVADRVTHISTGGGAAIEFLEGKPLPGIAALDDRIKG